MGDQDTTGWVPGAAAMLRDPLNAGVAAQMPVALQIEAQNVQGFCAWLACNSLHLEATPDPTMGGTAGVAFFRTLSVPTVVAALMAGYVNGATLEAARDVLVQRYLEDDDTQARIIQRARKLALNAAHDAALLRSEHGALFQRLGEAAAEISGA